MSAGDVAIGRLNATVTADESQFDAQWTRVLNNLRQTGAVSEAAQAKIAQLGASMDAAAQKHQAYAARMERAFQREAQQAQPLRELIRAQAEQARGAQLAALKNDILARSATQAAAAQKEMAAAEARASAMFKAGNLHQSWQDIQMIGESSEAAALKAQLLAESEGELGMASGAAASEGLRLQNAIGLVDNTMRGQFSRALADMVRGVSNFGFVMKLLPLAATAAGIVVLVQLAKEAGEKFEEWRQREARLAATMRDFQTALLGVTQSFKNSFLEAEIEADDLNNNHLKALQERLELIDNQSMASLIGSLKDVGDAADKVFGKKKSGQKSAFEEFKSEYGNLIQRGDQKDAAALLAGTLAQAQKVLALQQKIAAMPDYLAIAGPPSRNPAKVFGTNQLRNEYGAGYSPDDIVRQQALIKALKDQATNAALIVKTAGVKVDTARARTVAALPDSIFAYRYSSEINKQVEYAVRTLVGTRGSGMFKLSPDDEDRTREAQRLAIQGPPKGADVVAEMNEDIGRYGTRWNEYWRTMDRAAVDSARLQQQMREIAIRAQAAGGGFTKMQEQMALMQARGKEFRVEMQALEEERARIQGDTTLTAPEKATQLAQVSGQMQDLRGQNQLAAFQYALDAQMISPMQEFKRSLLELQQRFTDLGATMGGEFARDLQGFNETLVRTISTPSWQRQGRNIWGMMGAGVFRGIAGSALQAGEGEILKGLFGMHGKPTGAAGNPFHVLVDNAAGAAGVGGALARAMTATGGVGKGGGAGSMIGSVLAGMFQGAFAGGGEIRSNMPALVGELGAEVFVPHTSGTIIPHDRAFGTTVHQTVNIDATGSNDPAAMNAAADRAMARYLPHMKNMAIAAIRDHNARVPNSRRL